jgi:hypothetical protein
MSFDNDNADAIPRPLEFRPGMRRRVAAAVDALVALLDQIDDDADLEEDNPPEDDAPCEDVGDDEPSLGAPGTFYFPDQAHWAEGASDDREDESELLEPTGDEEPTLGWTGHGSGHPEMALRGYDDDREEESDFEWSVGPWELEFDGSEYL